MAGGGTAAGLASGTAAAGSRAAAVSTGAGAEAAAAAGAEAGAGVAAPPARAAASFSLSVSGRPSVDGDGTLGAGAAGRAGAGSTALASTTSPTGSGAAAGSGPAAGFAAPPLRAASRISCTLGRFAIALVLASACSPARSLESSTTWKQNNANSLRQTQCQFLVRWNDHSKSLRGHSLFQKHSIPRGSRFSNVRKSPGSTSQFMEPAIPTTAEPDRRAAASA